MRGKVSAVNIRVKFQERSVESAFCCGFTVNQMCDKTMTFSVNQEKETELKRNLTIIYDALVQKGYNPINQIVGYILSEDPTYITTFNNARSLIRHIDRDELLQVLVKSYLNE